jgi:hypothetical protein
MSNELIAEPNLYGIYMRNASYMEFHAGRLKPKLELTLKTQDATPNTELR